MFANVKNNIIIVIIISFIAVAVDINFFHTSFFGFLFSLILLIVYFINNIRLYFIKHEKTNFKNFTITFLLCFSPFILSMFFGQIINVIINKQVESIATEVMKSKELDTVKFFSQSKTFLTYRITCLDNKINNPYIVADQFYFAKKTFTINMNRD